jgi:hypothetical protein
MSITRIGARSTVGSATATQSRHRVAARASLLGLLAAVALLAAMPATAAADGPVAPIATSYRAKLSHVPSGLEAKIVDGYLRLWLRAPPRETVVVLDYRGVPYLRFARAGVAVNENSEMYYLNQTPVTNTPPGDLSRRTPAHWVSVSKAHDYEWHDGRLNGLAYVAIAPGQSYVGRWSIALRVDGHLTSISGGLWHAADPSLVWFWPIVVLLLCVFAAWRLRRPSLDARLARVLGVPALIALAAAGIARELHGRPTVSVFEYVELAVILLYAVWGLRRLLFGRPGYFTYFMIAFVAFWEGIDLTPTLLSGFVLVALPAVVVRVATLLCLGCGAALALLAFRLADEGDLMSSILGRSKDDEYDPEQLHEAYSVP